MDTNIDDSLLTTLDAIGVKKYTSEELHIFFSALVEKIRVGIERAGAPTTTDGGLMALPTSIEPISWTQVDEVPNGTPVITAACGGTNWVFAVATKHKDGHMELSEPVVRPIPEHQRQHTFQSLVDLIADEILVVGQEYDLLSTADLPIAISFGFPQHNVRTEEGDIDARLTTKLLPKFWQVTDLDESLAVEDQQSLTSLLRAALITRGFSSIGSIVFVNDTVAVALDVQHDDGTDLPVGFVFGTGTNAAMWGGTKKGIVNLEIGHADILSEDTTLHMMREHDLVPNTNTIMEYWMGGGYLPGRLAAAVLCMENQLLDDAQIAQSLLDSSNQAIISDLAAEDAHPQQLQLHVAPKDFLLLQEAARRVLAQAAQLIGIHIASVCSAVGYDSGLAHIPYEGSLLAKGYSVEKIALETVQQLLVGSNIQPYKASGILGIAKLALLKTQARKNA